MFLFTVLADAFLIIIASLLSAIHQHPDSVETDVVYGRWVTFYLALFLLIGLWVCAKLRSRCPPYRFKGLVTGIIPLLALEVYFIYLIYS